MINPDLVITDKATMEHEQEPSLSGPSATMDAPVLITFPFTGEAPVSFLNGQGLHRQSLLSLPGQPQLNLCQLCRAETASIPTQTPPMIFGVWGGLHVVPARIVHRRFVN